MVEPAARQACPPDRVLALPYFLLSRAALIVERNHPLGGAAQVDYNEPNPRVQLTRMPLDPGDDDPAHRGITPEPVGIVDILVASETPVRSALAQESYAEARVRYAT